VATDTTLLLRGLQDYHDSLQRHLQAMTQEYQTLDMRWQAFSTVYEGEAARQFHVHWQRTKQNFEAYISATQIISNLLLERITDLIEVDRLGDLR
jgi:uncharacterized protein YukE